jgi:hypothetical protein
LKPVVEGRCTLIVGETRTELKSGDDFVIGGKYASDLPRR